MKNRITYTAAAMAILALLMLSGGCGAYITKSIIDSDKKNIHPQVIEMGSEDDPNLDRGDKIYCVLKTGELVKGKFSQYSKSTQEEYAEDYAAYFRNNTGRFNLPALNDVIMIMGQLGRELECRFEGFNLHYSKFGILPTMLLVKKGDTDQIEIPLKNLKYAVNHQGDTLDLDRLSEEILQIDFPIITHVELRVKTETETIDRTEVEHLPADTINKKIGPIAGFKSNDEEVKYFAGRGAKCKSNKDDVTIISGRGFDNRKLVIPLADTKILYKNIRIADTTKHIAMNEIDYYGKDRIQEDSAAQFIGGLAVGVILGVCIYGIIYIYKQAFNEPYKIDFPSEY